MHQPQYMQMAYDERFMKLWTMSLPTPDTPIKNMKPYKIGKETIPMLIEKTDEGYVVTVDTAYRCVGAIIKVINNNIKEWVKDL